MLVCIRAGLSRTFSHAGCNQFDLAEPIRFGICDSLYGRRPAMSAKQTYSWLHDGISAAACARQLASAQCHDAREQLG
jgi:hypothetical protein